MSSNEISFAGKKAAFHTLGCKLNFSETSAIARLLLERGFQKTDFSEPADVYVINTCSVTENADKECRQIVKQALKQSPNAFVAVVGCYAQLKPDEISRIEGVDIVLGAREKFKLLDYLGALEKKPEASIHHCEIDEAIEFTDAYSIGDRTRTFLKVQDGCDYSCTFCTIPLARGTSRSDSLENVVRNAEKIAEQGVREIVLTGVNLGDAGYGPLLQKNEKKKRQYTFLELIQALEKVESIHRFRISSIEPNLLTDEIISFVASSKKFAPHFHIPLQSGSNRILKLMKRRYLRELYASRVELIKKLMPHCCIGADVIVGFPGETEEDFKETFDFLHQLDVSYLHVFTYSERENTEAALMSEVVPVSERKIRNKQLRILSEKKLRSFYEQNIDGEFSVLFESENKNGFLHGFTENYLRIRHPYRSDLVSSIQTIRVKGFEEDGSLEAVFSESGIPAL
jgi:threonylcarbamoyladenosine tRNA methylthiotransferase MtaB